MNYRMESSRDDCIEHAENDMAPCWKGDGDVCENFNPWPAIEADWLRMICREASE